MQLFCILLICLLQIASGSSWVSDEDIGPKSKKLNDDKDKKKCKKAKTKGNQLAKYKVIMTVLRNLPRLFGYINITHSLNDILS